VFVRARPSILHADLDAFFASVEQRDTPDLRGRPLAVGGGVVLAASYEARAYGVRSAMGARAARRLCPRLVVVPPRMPAYSEASRAVFAVFRDTAPVVEGLSIDEAFLDVGGLDHLAGPPRDIAIALRRQVWEEVGLPITIGAASTKFLAKVASALAQPDGLLIVPPAGELALLHLLPVERMWGVGPVTAAKLHRHGITTIGELARLSDRRLMEIAGRASGRRLHALARNHDPRRVRTGRRRHSMGAQRALGRRGPRTPAALDAVAVGLVDRLARRLRGRDLVARTVVLRLRFDDFSRAARARTLAEATAETPVVLAAARTLLAAARPDIDTRGITLLGITLTNLEPAGAVQLALPVEGSANAALDRAIDDVRERFGAAAVTRATLVGRDPGIEMPLLDDGG
jgi:DNA polymerase IV